MKRAVGYIWIMLVLMIAGSSCKKPFAPHLNTVTTNFLAVDGPIISGDSTFISLSRTTSLSDTTQNKAELKAVVSVEDDQNKLYPLTEKGKGQYFLPITNFTVARKYRLDIKTLDGKVYQSDFVPLKVTPAIDSIYFHQNSEATVLFYVNAHDGTNSTRYYRWDYKETWSYVALFKQIFQYKGGNVVPVVPDSPDDLTTCYRLAPSNQVFVGSSAKLAEDVIAAQLLGGLANGSEKLGHIYTMQLKQYALTQDGYNYYLNLKTNTEQLGSIFDSQPSLAKGNIHCITSPNDVVIGFVSASTVAAKQFNLHANDIQLRAPDPYGLDEWLHNSTTYRFYNAYYFAPPDTSSCRTAAISTAPYATFALRASKTFAKGDSLLFEGIPFIQADAPGSVGYAYYYAPKNCVDCRLKGGTNIRPSYFPAF